jgi:hypothetical protein
MKAVFAVLCGTAFAEISKGNLRQGHPQSYALTQTGATKVETSQAAQEAFVLDLLNKAVETDTNSQTRMTALSQVKTTLISFIERGINETEEFMKHLGTSVDNLQTSIPKRAKISQAHVDNVAKSFETCDKQLADRLAKVNASVQELSIKRQLHSTCRQEEVGYEQESSICNKSAAELTKFAAEDPNCGPWKAMKEMQPQSQGSTCAKQNKNEGYEEYLLRVRNAFANELLLYRQLKESCDSITSAAPSCDTEFFAWEGYRSKCNQLQTIFELAACEHGRQERESWDAYMHCYHQMKSDLEGAVSSHMSMVTSMKSEYRSTMQIECLMKNTGAKDPEAAIKACQALQLNKEVEKEFDSAKPALPEAKKPTFQEDAVPGTKVFETKEYGTLPSNAAAKASMACTLKPIFDPHSSTTTTATTTAAATTKASTTAAAKDTTMAAANATVNATSNVTANASTTEARNKYLDDLVSNTEAESTTTQLTTTITTTTKTTTPTGNPYLQHLEETTTSKTTTTLYATIATTEEKTTSTKEKTTSTTEKATSTAKKVTSTKEKATSSEATTSSTTQLNSYLGELGVKVTESTTTAKVTTTTQHRNPYLDDLN